MSTTPWGKATLVEEVTIEQSADDKRFATTVQLLEGERGESLLRFSYSTDGRGRRGPVTLRPADIHRLRRALTKTPRLSAALRFT